MKRSSKAQKKQDNIKEKELNKVMDEVNPYIKEKSMKKPVITSVILTLLAVAYSFALFYAGVQYETNRQAEINKAVERAVSLEQSTKK